MNQDTWFTCSFWVGGYHVHRPNLQRNTKPCLTHHAVAIQRDQHCQWKCSQQIGDPPKQATWITYFHSICKQFRNQKRRFMLVCAMNLFNFWLIWILQGQNTHRLVITQGPKWSHYFSAVPSAVFGFWYLWPMFWRIMKPPMRTIILLSDKWNCSVCKTWGSAGHCRTNSGWLQRCWSMTVVIFVHSEASRSFPTQRLHTPFMSGDFLWHVTHVVVTKTP